MPDQIANYLVSELYIHPLNPRAHHDPAEIAAKAKSLEIVGQIHNLACYRDPERDGIGVVAGGYRFLGFQQLEEARPGAVEAMGGIACKVTDDPLTAEAWAVAENVAQVPLSPAEEIRAYGKMARHGNSHAMIATAFCTTEAHVKRRLKLADLPEPALDALAAGEISLGVAQALTTADSEASTVAVLEVIKGKRYGEQEVRRMLHRDEVSATDRRAVFVGLEDYEAWDGPLTSDLFSDETWLGDEALLNRMVAAKLEIRQREAQEEGWAFVWTTAEVSPWSDAQMKGVEQIEPEPLNLPEADEAEYEELAAKMYWELTPEQKDRYRELEARTRGSFDEAQMAGLGIMLYINHAGELARIEGLRDKSAPVAPAADDAGDDSATAPAKPEPELSEAVKSDLRAIALRARQTAMLTRNELALDLLAFQLSLRPGWGKAFGLDTTLPHAKPEITDGLAESERLKAPAGSDDMTAKAFLAFQSQGKKHRNEQLTHALARLLSPGRESLAHHLNAVTEVDARAIWTPTAKNFFGRVRGPHLDGIVDALLHDADADRLDAFRKMKVKDKAKELDGLFNDASVREAWGLSRDQVARLDAWLPEIIAEATARKAADGEAA